MSSPDRSPAALPTPRSSPARRRRSKQGQPQQQFSPGSNAPLQPPPSSRPRSSAAFYGMLKKTKGITKKKTYGALYRGRKRAALMEEGDESDSSTGPEGLEYPGRSDRGVQSGGRSPFISRMPAGVPAAPSFYFSPQNTWDDGGGDGRGNAAGFGNVSSQQMQQQPFAYDVNNIGTIVSGVERALRQIVLCCGMFIAGTMLPERAPTARHALELSLVAWGTCLFIVVLGWFQSRQMQKRAQRQLCVPGIPSQSTPMANNLTAEPTPVGVASRGIQRLEGTTITTVERQDVFQGMSPDETSPTEPMSSQPADETGKKRALEVDIDDAAPPSPKVMRGIVPTRPRQHPQLENLYVMMAGTQERVFPNGDVFEIDNELFSGRMLLMFRTPDVDEPDASLSSSDPDSNSDSIVRYFRGKQRRFEFQWQFKLKKLPPGDVFMGAELEEPIHMGMIQRALATTALKFVKKMNQGFTYSLSDSYESGRSYLSFPVGTSMDRFNATKPGEPLPVLGREVMEDPEQMRQRKKGSKIEWSTDDVYTMALWSAYFDWIEWQILNFPGIRPFSATSVAGVQPIIMTLYTTPLESTEKDVVFEIEVSNGAKSTLGNEARRWNEANAAIDEAGLVEEETSQRLLLEERMETIESSDIGSIDENESADEDDDEDEMSEADVDDLEEDDEGMVMDESLDNIDTSCYLLSGASISLREGTGSFVASGGGYAVLQSSPTSSIVLEKIQSKKKKGPTHHPTTMIRNGDVVRVKLVDATSKAVKYLSLHRGWWLRWSSVRPRRSGSFYVRTGEPSGSLVVLGCPFSLTSRRWSRYLIGACAESSAKYGGRMLGIYKADKSSMMDEGGDEEEDDASVQGMDLDENDRDKRMMPLLLCAETYSGGHLPSPVKSPTRHTLPRQVSLEKRIAIPMLGTPGADLAEKSYEIDVPVCIEVMNREKRTKQLVYAVRVKETSSQCHAPEDSEVELGVPDGDKNQGSATARNTFVKLRTARDLAPILRLGVEYKPELTPSSDQWQQRFDFANQDELSDADSFTSSSDDSDSDDELDDEEGDGDQLHSFLIAGPNHSGVNETFTSDQINEYAQVFPDESEQDAVIRRTPSQQNLDGSEKGGTVVKRPSTKAKREKSIDAETVDEYTRQGSSMSETKLGSLPREDSLGLAEMIPDSEGKRKSKAKRAAVLGRVAKTVKASTVVTGKTVKSIGKGTVKGTVNAGRAAGRAIPVSSVVYNKQPRKHEPGGRVHRKRSDKAQMKMIGKALKSLEGNGNFSPSLVSGQLLAQDLSCRKVSQILSELSNAPNISLSVLDAIASLATSNSAQDTSFLRGSSAELGVKPLKTPDPKVDVDCVVARCVYEGRWVEELCVLYAKESHIAFYSPLAKKPQLVVSFDEILSARKCEEGEYSPLPGLHTMAIETPWKCHYLAFLEDSGRDSFLNRLNDALFHTNSAEQPRQSKKMAQEYESYMMSLESSLTGTTGKYRPVSISKKSKQKKQRKIFNGRKMPFDLTPVAGEEMSTMGDAQAKAVAYVEQLLTKALSFSPDTLDATSSRFIEFLDETSRLRTLPLQDIDLSSKEALCMFVNLYHVLLQHALLLAVDGLPSKRSVTHFKRCSCYEIGGDVFSLAELECCVIRGNTSRPFHIKSPFVDAAKKSRPYRMMYGLGATDHRINFILNNGDEAYPSAVPVLRPQALEDQMYTSASYFLASQVKIDKRKRTVYLPKVCDVYRNDFGMGDGLVCLSQCLIYLDERDQLAIAALLDDGVVSVKFQPNCQDFHPNLTELR